MASNPEDIAQQIVLACLNDPKIAAAIRDDWNNDRKISAIGRKAGLFYKAIYKEVVQAHRCAGRDPEQLQDLPKLAVMNDLGHNGANQTVANRASASKRDR